MPENPNVTYAHIELMIDRAVAQLDHDRIEDLKVAQQSVDLIKNLSHVVKSESRVLDVLIVAAVVQLAALSGLVAALVSRHAI